MIISWMEYRRGGEFSARTLFPEFSGFEVVKGIVHAGEKYSILQRLKSAKTSINLSHSEGYKEN